MSIDYARMLATATRLLQANGAAWTVTSTASNGAITSASRKGVRVRTIKHAEPNSQIQVGDFEFLFEADAVPVAGGRITQGAESFVIKYAEPLKPAATVLAWYVYGRKG